MVRVKSKKPVKTKDVTCTKCAYLLEYTGEDIKEGTHTDYTGDSDSVYWIVCPRCKEKVYVSRWRS
jgi:hypothetical protein